MPNIGLPEILIVLVIALVVFGPKRLPELGQSIGKGFREFKDSVGGDNDDDDGKHIRELAESKQSNNSKPSAVDGEVVTSKSH